MATPFLSGELDALLAGLAFRVGHGVEGIYCEARPAHEVSFNGAVDDAFWARAVQRGRVEVAVTAMATPISV
jgi:hypothetical protein